MVMKNATDSYTSGVWERTQKGPLCEAEAASDPAHQRRVIAVHGTMLVRLTEPLSASVSFHMALLRYLSGLASE